jgi:hypothetical protein
MISYAIPPYSAGYELTPDLGAGYSTGAVLPVAPDEADREELVIRKLGAKGWGRLHHFRNYYSTGWGDGRGRPLSPRSLEAFYRFMEVAAFPGGKFPSLFLTDDGNLELCWEDANGKALQVEFTPSGAEYFIEATGEEAKASHTELSEIAAKLAA